MSGEIEIVFQLLLAAVILQIDSGVDSLVLYGREVREARLPAAARTDQVICLGGLLVQTNDRGVLVGCARGDTDYGPTLRAAIIQYHGILGQVDLGRPGARKVAHSRIRLTH